MSQAELDRIVAVGRTYAYLAPPGNFYSWGGDNHHTLAISGRNEALFHQRYNQPVGGGSNAGPGLYVTTSLYDSSEYCPGVNGVLLQVEIPDGIPYIRITHAATMQALRTGVPPLNAQMLYRQNPDVPPVLVHFTGNWHCLKTTKGVGFRLFDGRGSTSGAIQNALDQLRLLGRNVAVAVLLQQLRADMRNQVH